ncbi:hypothetical protein BST36_04690 [Mycolicibacterium moriokaense]|nr:hypothetical protein [Mycolicibacterium moriokaense]MCV7040786.1 hypothetical protein [Mycolicibacterium moriokaense]ORB26553.1 hypothetical protein BST36_04690 [Mycolicibacterium moriokaense]
MKTSNFKRIAVAGAVSGALGLAAIGLGAGTASADDELDAIAPLVPGGLSGDWQSYLPLIESVGDLGSIANLGDLGSVGQLGGLGDLGSIANLGDLQGLMRLAGGF